MSVEQETPEEKPTEETPEKKDTDFVSKSVHNDLQAKYSRIESLNQSVIEENSSFKERISALEESLSGYKSQERENQLKSVEGPEQFQALLEESETTLRNQFGEQISQKDTHIQKLELQLKEHQVLDVVLGKALGRVRNDMLPYFKADIMSEVDVDRSNPNEFVIKDPKTGKPRYNPANPSLKMTIDDWLAEKEGARPSMFNPKGVHQGTVQQTGPGDASPINGVDGPKTREEWLQVRNTVKDRAKRHQMDRKFNL